MHVALSLRKMEVHLPKFKMEQSYDLHEILPHLGISNVFLRSANLTGLSQDPHLRVSQVTAASHTDHNTLITDADDSVCVCLSLFLSGAA